MLTAAQTNELGVITMKNILNIGNVENESCVVVFSGGQDSTTCLGLALEAGFKNIHCISFEYGQRHAVEILCAKRIIDMFDNVTHDIIPAGALSAIGNSALILGTDQNDVNLEHKTKSGLPASFVPNRNAFFLTLSHALAQKFEASYVITGVCETDYSGYPDCREYFIQSLEQSLNLGSEANIKILTPLMYEDKASTFKLAEETGFLDIVLNYSHTCYNGQA